MIGGWPAGPAGERRDHLAHAGDARRDGGHEHGRRVGGAPAGHVDADAVERPDALPEARAAGVAERPRALALAHVEGADAARGQREVAPHGRRLIAIRRGQVAGGHAQRRAGASVHAVEARA